MVHLHYCIMKLVVWYGYRLIDHNVVELNNVHRQIITIRKEHEVRKLNLKAKHEEKMRQAQIQFLWLLSASLISSLLLCYSVY